MRNRSTNPIIYEINTVVWLHELASQLGRTVTLADIPDSYWADLVKIGFDAVWLMGVWERSPESIRVSTENQNLQNEFVSALPDFTPEDNIGSAYAIHQYQVDSRLGGNEALLTLHEQLHAHNLKLILDFVPNHVARDHPWITEHPEYFIQGSAADLLGSSGAYFESNQRVFAFGKDPFFPPWQDTAQLNIFHIGSRLAAAKILDELGNLCDGVRCDMAMLCLNRIFAQSWSDLAGDIPEQEYWKDVISAIHLQHPGFLFLAEAYWNTENELLQLGFDACYDKVLYDSLLKGTASDVINRLSTTSPPPGNLIHFIENHDESRARNGFTPRKEVLGAITIATTPGYRLIHEGQMEGRRVRIPVFLSRRPKEGQHPERQAFYRTLLRIASSRLCQDGEWQIGSLSGWEDNQTYLNLVSWTWRHQAEILIVVQNYSDQPGQGTLHLPWEDLPGHQWKLVDLLKGTIYHRDGDGLTRDGLFVDLPEWDFHLLWCTPVDKTVAME